MNGNSRNLDWAAMKIEYAHDAKLTISLVAKKYNIPESTVRWHSTKYQWNAARQDFQSKVEGKLIDAVASKDAVAKLKDINTKQLAWNAEMRFVINSLLKARNDEGAVVLRDDVTIADAQRAILSMAELYRLDRLALGASTDNVSAATTRNRIDDMSDEEVLAELERVRSRVVTVN